MIALVCESTSSSSPSLKIFLVLGESEEERDASIEWGGRERVKGEEGERGEGEAGEEERKSEEETEGVGGRGGGRSIRWATAGGGSGAGLYVLY